MAAKEWLKWTRSPHCTWHIIHKWVIAQFSLSLQVLVNITLTYDTRQNKIYEQCKGLVKFNFEGDDFQVTAPFRKSFIPSVCPTITNSTGAQLVVEEYFCPTGKQIKFQPEGYTSPIDVCGKVLSLLISWCIVRSSVVFAGCHIPFAPKVKSFSVTLESALSMKQQMNTVCRACSLSHQTHIKN